MHPLSIGIDGYNLAMPRGTGVATYGHTLADVLRAGGHPVHGVFGVDAGSDPRMREVLFFDRIGRADEPVSDKRRLRDRRRADRRALLPFGTRRADEVPLTGRVATAPLAERLPRFDRLATFPLLFEIAHRRFRRWGRFVRLRVPDPPAVMHWTYPVPIELADARNVYTLHDIVPLRLPYTTLDEKRHYRALLAACIARAAAICTVSEASRADIAVEFAVDPARIHNCYQASPLPPGFLDRTDEEDAAVIEGIFGLRQHGYFLYFGAVEPKKNVGRLIEGYLSLQTATPLVLVGGRSWRAEGELRLLDRPDLADRVVRLDYLPRPLLLRLIRGAKAVTFPSIYEGFGLPVLEAMQLGTPVLTARASALPEIAGDAALLVDPYDVADIAAGLRPRLAAAAPDQARRFSAAAYLVRLEGLYAAALAFRGASG